jgi:hypothetical protein
MSYRLPLLPLLALLALASCASVKQEVPHDVNYLLDHEQFAEAVEEAARVREARPGDADAERQHKRASVAYLMQQGRRSTFQDQDDDALAVFRRALAINPGSELIELWINKTSDKLSRRWHVSGLQAHAEGHLNSAYDAYVKALEYWPGNLSAREGAGQVLLQLNYREGLSEEYYKDAVRALHEYMLWHSRINFLRVAKYRPGDPRPEQRVSEVEEKLTTERHAVAATFFNEGLYPAARNEFRLILLMNEDDEKAQAGLEAASIESQAFDILRAAQLLIIKGRFEAAIDELEVGMAMTTAQKEDFEETRATIQEARHKHMYDDALDLEHDFDFESAITAYAAILEEVEWYEDVRPRLDALQDYVSRAANLYAKAAATEDMELRQNLLRQIEVFWPEYLDIRDQLRGFESN